MAYGIILTPPADISDRLVDFAAQVTSFSTPISSVGPHAVPHLTLAHIQSDFDVATRWWREVTKIVPSVLPVQLVGLMFSPISTGNYYVPEGGIYFGLEAIRSSILNEAHQRILTVARELGIRPLGAIDEEYRPHVTLGVLTRFSPRKVELSSNIVKAKFDGKLKFGKLRQYGTFNGDDLMGN
jgi:2'-5' RNA ligase